jgi:hypothetical protein
MQVLAHGNQDAMILRNPKFNGIQQFVVDEQLDVG